jgi:hypothetical protein
MKSSRFNLPEKLIAEKSCPELRARDIPSARRQEVGDRRKESL